MNKAILAILILVMSFSCKNEKPKEVVSVSQKIAEIPESIKLMIDAAQKDTGNIDLKLNIVASLDSLGYHKEALTKLDELIAKDSFNNDFWLKRGLVCKQAGDTAAAIKAFRFAAKIYPTPISMMELANLYAETKNPLALSICRQLLEMNPVGDYNPQAYLLAGIYYAKIGDKKNALIFFNKSIAEDFHFSEAYLERGYLLYNDKKFADALKNFVQLSQINQPLSDGYYWQAKCFEAMNDKANAIKMYQKTLQLDNTIKEANIAIERLSK